MKFSKRNAVVGYLTLKALSRFRSSRRKRDRRNAKVALAVTLGVVSLGVFAALMYFWRQQSTSLEQAFEDAQETAAEAAEEAGEAAASAADTVAEAASDEGLPSALEPAPAT